MNSYKPSTGEEPIKIESEVAKVKRHVAPIIIETIQATSEKAIYAEAFEKKEIMTKVPVPDGHKRCIVLIEFDGMEDKHYPGDVFDCPDRRFKTLCNRGYVREYEGTRIPNKDR